MKRIRLLLAIMASYCLAGCADGQIASCQKVFRGSYTGAVVSTINGDAWLALSTDCRVLLSGSYEFHSKVSEAAQRSLFEGPLKPLRVSFDGDIGVRPTDNGILAIRVTKSREISTNVTDGEATAQFQMLLHRPLPSRRSAANPL